MSDPRESVRPVQPWFIATEAFGPRDGEGWTKFIEFSGLKQLDEVVSLDPMLCPTVLPETKDEYWPHIVNENFMLHFFVDLDFLLAATAEVPVRNLLCVYRNPIADPPPLELEVKFEFLGYDLVDTNGGASALTNCGGFPDAFANEELSSKGLLRSRERAFEVREHLLERYPQEHHADCHVWAISRAVT